MGLKMRNHGNLSGSYDPVNMAQILVVMTPVEFYSRG